LREGDPTIDGILRKTQVNIETALNLPERITQPSETMEEPRFLLQQETNAHVAPKAPIETIVDIEPIIVHPEFIESEHSPIIATLEEASKIVVLQSQTAPMNRTEKVIDMYELKETGLESKIESFEKQEQQWVTTYLDRVNNRKQSPQNALYCLMGWNFPADASINEIAPLFLAEGARQSSGGHYIRWHGKGIALNPGPGFLDNFHAKGLCIRDIDFVIVTKETEDAYGDIGTIYELNQHLNKCTPELQIIHYYLQQNTYQKLSSLLKPHLKQARNAIHNLQIFQDSPDVEKIELSPNIVLHYFQPSIELSNAKLEAPSWTSGNLAIKLDLLSENNSTSLQIGYVSGLGWSSSIAKYLGKCNVLLAAFGNTDINDFAKLTYNNHSLGYNGCSTLQREIEPRLMLLTEFGGREGDIRLEVTKKMRLETKVNALSNLFPADIGMVIDLKDLTIQCSLSNAFTPPALTSVTTFTPQFGRLRYLSAELCI